ncbi:MAG: rhodanese-like domain-containing protein [Chloroflexota bacterium]
MLRRLTLILIVFLTSAWFVACTSGPDGAEPMATSLDVGELLGEAETAYAAGDFEEAFTLSQKAVEAAPTDLDAWEMVKQAAVAQSGDNYLQHLPDRRYRITPEAFLVEQVNGREYFVLDVREPEEFAESHIEGAINIPLRELLRNVAELPTTTTPILIYCRSQKRSTHALVILRELGYVQAFNLEGGYTAYQEYRANNPLPKAGPTPTLPPKSNEGC